MIKKLNEKWVRMLEFFVVGLVLGVVEDVVVIRVATDVPITLRILGVALMVALPFAIVSEIIVDHPSFWNFLRKKPRVHD